MKLSIITINYNNLEGLKRTADSVLAQTWTDFEWIIVDGNSNDGSKEYIEDIAVKLQTVGTRTDSKPWNVGHFSMLDFAAEGWAQEHEMNRINDASPSTPSDKPRLLWCSEPDKGIYNAMNKGIKQAHGDYLQFLNSGDIYFKSNTLKQVVNHLYKDDIIYGYAVIQNENNTKKRVNIRHEVISCYDLTRDTINHQCAFIRKELFYKYGLYDESYKIVSDWKFFFDAIVIHKCSTKHIDLDIVIYDTFGISQTRKIDLEKERMNLLKLYLPEYVIDDYILRFQINEILRHKFTKSLMAILYRLTIKLEDWKLIH